MKDFLKTYLGVLGLALYYIIAAIIRIPVAFVLLLMMTIFLLIWAPFTGGEYMPKWAGDLYDWYVHP